MKLLALMGGSLLFPADLVQAGFDPSYHPDRPVERPIDISVFEMFKIGPGPSSSHTIGPMRAGFDFKELMKGLSTEQLAAADSLVVYLYGSLASTGLGHGTHKAVTAGLMGTAPEDATVEMMEELYVQGNESYTICCNGCSWSFGMKNFVFDTTEKVDAPCNDVLTIVLYAGEKRLLEREYYSVGGGFLQWKGWTAPARDVPVHRFDCMNGLLACVASTGRTLPEIMLDNEMSMMGSQKKDIYSNMYKYIEAMERSVDSGLSCRGVLAGTLHLERQAAAMFEAAKHLSHEDAFLAKMSAYAQATAEENADGHPIVTAPTCGSAGVMPAVLRMLQKERNVSRDGLVDGMLTAAAVGMLAKRNASIAAADVGCQGEIGVSSAMAAAMIAQTLDGDPTLVENAAALALEHHLGLTCDPVGGYVQIPCISRCAMGAVEAWNAYVMAKTGRTLKAPIGLDLTIRAMNETGRDMNEKYRETAQGGLALFYTQQC